MFMFNDTPSQVTGSHQSLHFSRRPRNRTDEVNGLHTVIKKQYGGGGCKPCNHINCTQWVFTTWEKPFSRAQQDKQQQLSASKCVSNPTTTEGNDIITMH